MNPATINALSTEAVLAEIAKIWGPMSPEFGAYFAQQEKIDLEEIFGRETTLSPHFKVEGKVTLTPLIVRGMWEARKLKLNPDDVIMASFPKSGTTWVQEIVYLVMSDCDFASSESKSIDERCPTLEWPECTFKGMQEMPSPRVIKTHTPYSMLPGGQGKKDFKIVYATRNPKDLAVSMYHFYKLLTPLHFDGDMKDMLNLFLADAHIYAPFHKHVLEYWDHVKDGNVLVVKYEDLHKDAEKEVKRIAKFLGKNFTDEQIKGIVHATSFQQMAAQGSKNHSQWADKQLTDSKAGKFMRKGTVGDWKLHFDEEMNKRFDEYILKNFGNSDLKYDYE